MQGGDVRHGLLEHPLEGIGFDRVDAWVIVGLGGHNDGLGVCRSVHPPFIGMYQPMSDRGHQNVSRRRVFHGRCPLEPCPPVKTGHLDRSLDGKGVPVGVPAGGGDPFAQKAAQADGGPLAVVIRQCPDDGEDHPRRVTDASQWRQHLWVAATRWGEPFLTYTQDSARGDARVGLWPHGWPHVAFWSIRDRIVGFRSCERMTSAGIRTRRPRRSHPLHVIHHVVAVEAEMSGSGMMTAGEHVGFTRAAKLSVRAS